LVRQRGLDPSVGGEAAPKGGQAEVKREAESQVGFASEG